MLQSMTLAGSIIRDMAGNPQLDQRELETSYTGPRHGLGDVARMAAALGAIVLYAGLLGIAGR